MTTITIIDLTLKTPTQNTHQQKMDLLELFKFFQVMELLLSHIRTYHVCSPNQYILVTTTSMLQIRAEYYADARINIEFHEMRPLPYLCWICWIHWIYNCTVWAKMSHLISVRRGNLLSISFGTGGCEDWGKNDHTQTCYTSSNSLFNQSIQT